MNKMQIFKVKTFTLNHIAEPSIRFVRSSEGCFLSESSLLVPQASEIKHNMKQQTKDRQRGNVL